MCGRYKMDGDWSEVALTFPWTAFEGELLPRYNIAPTDEVLTITDEPQARMRRWGLLPFWAKSPKGKPLINARAESVATKPAFRDSFAKRRCLIPATGFYEWTSEMGRKQPYLFTTPQKVFAFAGIHSTWKSPEGEQVPSCSIITTSARGEIERYHDRMPAIVAPEDYQEWLNPDTTAERLLELLAGSVSSLEPTRVSQRVNSVKNDDPECCLPEQV